VKTQGVTSGLAALLQSTEPVFCFDLYTFTLGGGAALQGSPLPEGGQVLRFTTADIPLTIAGQEYQTGILWDHSKIELKLGMESDTLQVNAYATPADLVNGIPFHQFLRQGGLDNAYLLLQRAFYPVPGGWFVDGWFTPPGWFQAGQILGEPAGVIRLFSGVVTEVVTGGLTAQIKIDSHLYTLDIKLPRNLYQRLCNHALYGQGCGLNRANYQVVGQVQSGSTLFQLNVSLSGSGVYPDGYFSLGVLQFTSGDLEGTIAGIQTHAGSAFTLTPPLLSAPAPGDTFRAWPGCDRALSTCTNKYNNQARFRGFPWVPVPETAT
jgi:hypothetical protein